MVISIVIGILLLGGFVASIIIFGGICNKSVIYYNSESDSDDFRDSVAWWVIPDMTRPADEHFGELHISKHLYEALFSLGIIYSLQKLPHELILGDYEEGILIGSGVVDAVEILRDKASSLPQSTYDWHCGEQIKPERIEYRIKVDAVVLKQELIMLADFLSEAASNNYAVQLWL
jgi:hypothetical protein